MLEQDVLDETIANEKSDLMFQLFHQAIHAGWTAIYDKKENTKNKKIDDFNTTLLCVALKKYDKKWALASYWIGDGGLVVYQPNGKKDKVIPLGVPDGGEFAGQTKFFTMREEIAAEPIKKRFHFCLLDDFKALFLMSDGITDPFFPAEANIANIDFWDKFWNDHLPKHFPGFFDPEKDLKGKTEALLNGLNFKIEGNHDDRTLMMITSMEEIKKTY